MKVSASSSYDDASWLSACLLNLFEVSDEVQGLLKQASLRRLYALRWDGRWLGSLPYGSPEKLKLFIGDEFEV